MTLLRFPTRISNRLTLIFALAAAATPLHAQGIVDMVVPHEGMNAETAAYHAKVRDRIGSVLQVWAGAIERKDSVALAATYTPNAHSIVGREPEGMSPLGIVNQIFSTELGGAHVDVTVEDFDMSGDMAFVSAVLIVPASSADAKPVFVQSLFVFRFDDWRERWQIREQFIDWRKPPQ